jgi:predicted Zn-dependent protease
MRNTVRQVFFVLMPAFLTLSCAGSLGLNLFPESKDIELGRQIDKEIRTNTAEYPLLSNRPDVRNYVEQIGKKILSSPDIKKKGQFAYTFDIIHDDSTINAFCTPGGYIYVYTGLLKFVDNEATLAGVLGHEIAHAERRHATRRMSSVLGVQVLLGLLFGENPTQAAQIAGNLFGGLALLKNSRDDEMEADTYSFRYLQATEYYPAAIRLFFEKIAQGRRGGALERLLSTHPLPQDRMEHVEQLMKQHRLPEPSEHNLVAVRYQQFKQTLP